MSVLPDSFIVSETHITNHAYVAAECLMIWDILLTLDDEVRHVWYAPWTMGKALFFINRYCPPVLMILDLCFLVRTGLSDNTCKLLFIVPAIMAIVTFISIEFTLLLRIHALYGSKYLFLFLILLCMASAGTMLGTTLYWFSQMSWSGDLPAGCSTISFSPSKGLLGVFWTPLFIFEISVFTLTVFDTYRNRDTVHLSDSTKLASIIYRDDLIYYLCMITISIVNLTIWTSSSYLTYLGVGIMRSLQSIICSRLTLNVREIVYSTKMIGLSGNLDSFTFLGRWAAGSQP